MSQGTLEGTFIIGNADPSNIITMGHVSFGNMNLDGESTHTSSYYPLKKFDCNHNY